MSQLGPKQQNWINELRHGGHRQVSGHLQWDDCYCCLGVACVATESESTRVIRNEHTLPGGIVEREVYGEDLAEQPQVFAAIGLHDESGSPNRDDPKCEELLAYCRDLDWLGIDEIAACTLTRLNDDSGLTFEQIADILEKFPTVYFKEAR